MPPPRRAFLTLAIRGLRSDGSGTGPSVLCGFTTEGRAMGRNVYQTASSVSELTRRNAIFPFAYSPVDGDAHPGRSASLEAIIDAEVSLKTRSGDDLLI